MAGAAHFSRGWHAASFEMGYQIAGSMGDACFSTVFARSPIDGPERKCYSCQAFAG
jgi:hypothetical protein